MSCCLVCECACGVHAWILRRSKLQKNKYAWWDTAPCLWQIYFKIIRNISIINKYLHTSGITLQTCEWLGSNFCLDRNTNNFSLHRLDNQKKEDTCIGNMISLDYIHRIVCQYFMLWRFIIMLLFFNNGPLLIEVLIRGIIIIVWILCYIDFVNYLEKIHTFSVVDISVYKLVLSLFLSSNTDPNIECQSIHLFPLFKIMLFFIWQNNSKIGQPLKSHTLEFPWF